MTAEEIIQEMEQLSDFEITQILNNSNVAGEFYKEQCDSPSEWRKVLKHFLGQKGFACGSKKKFSTNRAKGYLCKKNFAKKIKIPEAKLEEWAEMTNENAHTLVGASIADFLAQYDANYKKYSDFFNLIEKHSDKEGHLAYPGGWVRPLLYQKLYEDIEYDFGKEILAQIKSAL